MNKIREEYYGKWLEAYEKLNEKQKSAVDQIEGPVMTIAGPGTGKTQLLAVRIGKILLETDVLPSNILCMTFTDAGVTAMRERLAQFIGPDGYQVGIFTFHSFCSMIIRENPFHFGDLRELQKVSDLEVIQYYREILDGLPDDHHFKKGRKDPSVLISRIREFVNQMKQENWTPQLIDNSYQEFIKSTSDLENLPYNYTYQVTRSNYKKGDPKLKDIKTDTDKYTNSWEASKFYDEYNKKLAFHGRMDYQDMILWVINKFKTDDILLGRYQERFQYLLIDEYQDTNGSQNELIMLLSDYWDKPNIFIVGDDDQAIYRFQGANMDSIVEFKNKFSPAEVILSNNYRSSQKILDKAKRVIENNQTRLVSKYPYMTKELIESRNNKNNDNLAPQIWQFENTAAEEIGVIDAILALNQKGVPWNEIAIIYTKHALADDMARYMSQVGIPIQLKKSVNVLSDQDVLKLQFLMQYLYREAKKPNSEEDMIFEILHFDFINIKALEIAHLHLFIRKQNAIARHDNDNKRKLSWREVLNDEDMLLQSGVKNVEKFKNISIIIEQLITDVHNVTVQTLFENILTKAGVLDHVMKHVDKSWKLQVINTFFNYIKSESAAKRNYELKDLLDDLDLMNRENIALPVNKIIGKSSGVQFMTAYGAKGLEFDYVFIIKVVENLWEKKSGNNSNFSIIPGIVKTVEDGSEEDQRRLFYVALTRAKDYVYITYSTENEENKPLVRSKFVEELVSVDEVPIKKVVDDDSIEAYKAELMKNNQGQAVLIDLELADQLLESFTLSITHLNKYISCPTRFYFESLLRVPSGRNASMGYGSAMHHAMQFFIGDIKLTEPKSIGSLEKFKEYFEQGIELFHSHFTDKERANYLRAGKYNLELYYEKYKQEWFKPKSYETEYKIDQILHRNVPINGVFDRIDVYSDFVEVIDYKTGDFTSTYTKVKLEKPSEKQPNGGDYWRQIVFYRILLDEEKRHKWHMTSGTIDFLEEQKEELKKVKIVVSPEDIKFVSDLIVDVNQKIKAKIFSPGCGDAKCQWCNFVKAHMPANLADGDVDEMGEG